MPKRTKYVKGGPLKQTFKTNVADLNVYFDKGAYSADIGTDSVRAGVQGSGFKPPSVIKGSANYKGFEAAGSYNLNNKNKSVTATKRIGKNTKVKVGVQKNYDGVGGFANVEMTW